MGRYSPTQTPEYPDLRDYLYRGVSAYTGLKDRERRHRIEDETLERERDLEDLKLALEGIRRGSAPTVSGPAQPGIFEGAGITPSGTIPPTPVPAPRPGRPGAFVPGIGFGMPGLDLGPGGTPGFNPEADVFSGSRLGPGQRDGAPSVSPTAQPDAQILRPGVSGPGMSTPSDVFAGAQVGLQAPPTVTTPDPRYEQLTDEFYRDTSVRPPMSERMRLALYEQQREEAERAALIAALAELENVTPEQARAFGHGGPASAVFPRPEGRGEQYFRDLDREQGIRQDYRLDTLEEELRLRQQYRPPPGEGGSGGTAGLTPNQAARERRQRIEDHARMMAGRVVRPGRETPQGAQDFLLSTLRARFPDADMGELGGIAQEALADAERETETQEGRELLNESRRQKATGGGATFTRNGKTYDAETGREITSSTAGQSKATGSSAERGRAPQGGQKDERRVITRDQYNYLRSEKGMTDAEIRARYRVQ